MGRTLLVSGVLFALLFETRAGMSAGLDPLALDFGAGAFGDEHVPAWWITFAATWKYLCWSASRSAWPWLRGLPPEPAHVVALAVVAIGVGRAAVLLGMVQWAQGSFWTSMRVVMSDLPFALLFALVGGLTWTWASLRR